MGQVLCICCINTLNLLMASVEQSNVNEKKIVN